MGRIRSALASLRAEQDGLTLIELLVAATLGLVVVGGAMVMLLGAVRSEPRTASNVGAIQEARVVAERITRELRQGASIVQTPSASSLAIVTYVKANSCSGGPGSSTIPCRVTYSCTGGACTRQVSEPDGTAPGPAIRVVDGLADNSVFSYSPGAAEPEYVGVSFQLETENGGGVTLGDGAALRNFEDEGPPV